MSDVFNEKCGDSGLEDYPLIKGNVVIRDGVSCGREGILSVKCGSGILLFAS